MKLNNHKPSIGNTSGKAISLFLTMLAGLSTVAMACQENDACAQTEVIEEKQEQKGKSWMRPAHVGKNTAAYFCACGHDIPEGSKITAVTSDIARSIELHDHINDNGIMCMRLIAFVEIKDGKSGMAPGGKHIMIMGLKKGLKVGDKVDRTLKLEKRCGSCTQRIVQFVVQ